MKISIPYGKGYEQAELPAGVETEVIDLPQKTGGLNKRELIAQALANIDFEKIALSDSLAVVVSDVSRPVPNGEILEQLWSQLEKWGMTRERLTLFVACGLHQAPGQEEIKQIVGEYAAQNFKIVVHEAAERYLQYIGKTSRGTPVKINAQFLQAEVKIAIGLVQPHQIAGFSGGAKSVAIGLGGKETITANHALLDHPACRAGNILNNPARQEIEEIGRMSGLNFLINVITDSFKQSVFINAGCLVESYTEAVEFAKQFYRAPVQGKKDLVIVSAGGYPKDLNLYQAQKALNAGVQILKPDGVAILVAKCEQGAGNRDFMDYLGRFSCPAELIKTFKHEPFCIGPHKAYLWAKKVAQNRVILVSALDSAVTGKLMVECARSLQEALAKAQDKLRPGGKVGIIPHASGILPELLIS